MGASLVHWRAIRADQAGHPGLSGDPDDLAKTPAGALQVVLGDTVNLRGPGTQ